MDHLFDTSPRERVDIGVRTGFAAILELSVGHGSLLGAGQSLAGTRLWRSIGRPGFPRQLARNPYISAMRGAAFAVQPRLLSSLIHMQSRQEIAAPRRSGATE